MLNNSQRSHRDCQWSSETGWLKKKKNYITGKIRNGNVGWVACGWIPENHYRITSARVYNLLPLHSQQPCSLTTTTLSIDYKYIVNNIWSKIRFVERISLRESGVDITPTVILIERKYLLLCLRVFIIYRTGSITLILHHCEPKVRSVKPRSQHKIETTNWFAPLPTRTPSSRTSLSRDTPVFNCQSNSRWTELRIDPQQSVKRFVQILDKRSRYPTTMIIKTRDSHRLSIHLLSTFSGS